MQSINSVVVGTGFIGPVHVEALRRVGVGVLGMLASSPEKSRELARQLGLPPRYETYQDVLDDPAVDVVHLATPNRLHFPQAAAALRAGKHVLCEKPLAMDSSESAELVRLAQASGRAAGVAYNIRYYPLCQQAAALVRGGEVGEVLHVQGSYVQDWLLRDTDFNWRVDAQLGGPLRAVADIGTHWLDLVQFITQQRVTAVCADLRTVHPRRFRPQGSAQTFGGDAADAQNGLALDVTTEDCGSILLRFDNGSNGCLWVSQTTAGRKNCLRFEIGGTRRALAWNSETPNELWIGQRDAASQCLQRDPAVLSAEAAACCSYPGGHNEGFPDSFKQLFRKFYGYLQAGDYQAPPPFPSFADGHHEILLCEAVLASHHQQKWVSLPATDS